MSERDEKLSLIDIKRVGERSLFIAFDNPISHNSFEKIRDAIQILISPEPPKEDTQAEKLKLDIEVGLLSWRPIDEAPRVDWQRLDLWAVHTGPVPNQKRYPDAFWADGKWMSNGGYPIEWQRRDPETGRLESCQITHFALINGPIF